MGVNVGIVGSSTGIDETRLKVGSSDAGVGMTGEGSLAASATGDLFVIAGDTGLAVETTGDTGLPIVIETVGDTGLGTTGDKGLAVGTTGERDLVDTTGDGGFCLEDPAPVPEFGLGGAPILVLLADDPGSLTPGEVDEEAGRGPRTVLGAGGALTGYICVSPCIRWE